PSLRNSAGIESGDRAALTTLLSDIRTGAPPSPQAAPLINGTTIEGRRRAALSPADGGVISQVSESEEATVAAAMAAAAAGFPRWAAAPVDQRAAALERAEIGRASCRERVEVPVVAGR